MLHTATFGFKLYYAIFKHGLSLLVPTCYPIPSSHEIFTKARVLAMSSAQRATRPRARPRHMRMRWCRRYKLQLCISNLGGANWHELFWKLLTSETDWIQKLGGTKAFAGVESGKSGNKGLDWRASANKLRACCHLWLFSQALMAELKLMISASKDLVCSSASTSNASFQASPALHALIAALKEITSVCSPDHAPIVSKSVAHCHLPLFSVALTAAL